MKEHIHHLLEQTVANLKSAGVLPADLEARVQVDRCKEKAHGDLATNLAMLLAKPARKNPRELAAAIIEHLPASDLIAKVEIAGPAFINFFFDPHWLAGQVEASYRSVWVLTFGGGTNEIQRDIIGMAGLGLPREQRRK